MTVDEYLKARDDRCRDLAHNKFVESQVDRFGKRLAKVEYVKNFTWMGRPILQLPSDMFVMQELIWTLKPDVVIETGMAFGGSAVFYASIVGLYDMTATVITIDIEVRKHNRDDVNDFGFGNTILMVEGDSVAPATINEVRDLVGKDVEFYNNTPKVLVALDSNHTHAHVLRELQLYSPLVTVGSYIVVFDTTLEYLPKPKDRPWGPGNSPMTAVMEFMDGNEEFVIDKEVEARALVTSAKNGWLRRVR